MTEFKGLLVGVLIGEGSFTSDHGRPHIAVVRHLTLLRNLELLIARVPTLPSLQGIWYGGRSLLVTDDKGEALRQVASLLESCELESLDDHVFEDFAE